jgi:glycosyltransferase involved in cell wall biosynthesis
MEAAGVQRLARELSADNIEFCPPVPLARLPEEIAAAEVCLGGHFGASGKAARVIAGKTFQCLSMGKAVIVGENAANRELLTPGVDAAFCAMNDPAALAEAIQRLVGDAAQRQRLGAAARQTLLERASLPVLTAELRAIVQEALERPSAAA